MERNRLLTIVLIGLVGFSVLAAPCEARLVTVAITAEVTEVLGGEDALQGKVQVGDAITGSYTYDTSATSLSTVGGRYEFSAPPCAMIFEVGGFTFQTDPNIVRLKADLDNNLGAIVSFVDRFTLESSENLPLSDDIGVHRIKLFLDNENMDDEPYRPLIGLLSDALPGVAPDLRHWPTRELTMWGYGPNSASYQITAQLTVARPASGPERLIYVDEDAAGDGDGSSWDSAYRYLQDALVDANLAAKPVEVRVAQGRYRPDEGGVQVLGDREAAFALMNEVTLKGGYAGSQGPDPNARNPQLHETILTGDLLGDDLPGFRNRRDNSHHVIVALDTDESAVLDGFTITSGSADGLPADGSVRRDDHTVNGGGLYVDGGALTIRQCMFRDNHAYEYGGGAYVADLPSRVHDTAFTGNTAGSHGGALYMGSDILLQGCLLQGNTALLGGAISRFDDDLDLYLINSTVADNRAFKGNAIDNALPNEVFFFRVSAYNSILWNGRYNPDYRALRACYSDMHGGGRSLVEATLNVDPRFAAPGHWVDPNDLGVEADPNDPRAVWVEGDYHLKSEAGRWDVAMQSWVLDDVTSPCIDAGDPASVIDNEPVPHGERINMGAYGGTAEASKSTVDGPQALGVECLGGFGYNGGAELPL